MNIINKLLMGSSNPINEPTLQASAARILDSNSPSLNSSQMVATNGSDVWILDEQRIMFRYNPVDNTRLQRASTNTAFRDGAFIHSPGKGSLYLIGGVTGSSPQRVTNQYNIANNTWATVPAAQPDSTIYNMASVQQQDFLYVFGGNDGATRSRKLRQLNPYNNVWTMLPECPTGFVNPQMVAAPSRNLYVYGYNSDKGVVSELWQMDTVLRTWTRLADLPIPRDHTSMAMVGDKIFVYGGRTTTQLRDFWVYDIPSNKWTMTNDLGIGPRQNSILLAMNTGLYLYGGFSSSAAGSFVNQWWKITVE